MSGLTSAPHMEPRTAVSCKHTHTSLSVYAALPGGPARSGSEPKGTSDWCRKSSIKRLLTSTVATSWRVLTEVYLETQADCQWEHFHTNMFRSWAIVCIQAHWRKHSLPVCEVHTTCEWQRYGCYCLTETTFIIIIIIHPDCNEPPILRHNVTVRFIQTA